MNEVLCADGGILRELCKESWGQLTLRTVPPGATAGGHRHPNTAERWWVVSGQARVTLDGVVVEPSRDVTLRVGAGVWHQIENVGGDDVVLVYWSNRWYEDQEKTP